MRARKPVLAALAVVLAASTWHAAPAFAAAATPDDLAVTGYALGGDTPDALVDQEAPALAEIGIDGVTVSEDGTRVGHVTTKTRHLLAQAHADGLRGSLLVGNYSDKVEDFSPAVGARLLRSDAHVEAVARQLAGYAATYGFDAITVDLESLRTADGPGLVRLVTRLQALMPAEKTVSVDLMSAGSVAGYQRRGYQLGTLAKHADVLALMAYDQHGPWDPSDPGPVGALDWQRRVLEALLTKVPADQVDLGVAGYGYSWPRRGTGTVRSPQQMRDLVASRDVPAVWDETAGEWTATLPGGTVLWWADRHSYDLRTALAQSYGLHGVAVWRLGLADSLV